LITDRTSSKRRSCPGDPAAGAGRSVSAVARVVGRDIKRVCLWGQRFVRKRLRGLEDLPRSGHWLAFSPSVAAELVKLACELPDKRRRSLSTWTCAELARTLRRDGVVRASRLAGRVRARSRTRRPRPRAKAPASDGHLRRHHDGGRARRDGAFARLLPLRRVPRTSGKSCSGLLDHRPHLIEASFVPRRSCCWSLVGPSLKVVDRHRSVAAWWTRGTESAPSSSRSGACAATTSPASSFATRRYSSSPELLVG